MDVLCVNLAPKNILYDKRSDVIGVGMFKFDNDVWFIVISFNQL